MIQKLVHNFHFFRVYLPVFLFLFPLPKDQVIQGHMVQAGYGEHGFYRHPTVAPFNIGIIGWHFSQFFRCLLHGNPQLPAVFSYPISDSFSIVCVLLHSFHLPKFPDLLYNVSYTWMFMSSFVWLTYRSNRLYIINKESYRFKTIIFVFSQNHALSEKT